MSGSKNPYRRPPSSSSSSGEKKKKHPKDLKEFWMAVYIEVAAGVASATDCKDRVTVNNWARMAADQAVEECVERFSE